MTPAPLERILTWAVLIAALVVAPPAQSQISLDDLTPDRSGEAAEELTLEQRIERTEALVPAIEQELASTRSLLEAERGSDRPIAVAELVETVDQLRQLLFLYEQLIAEYQRSIEIEASIQTARDDRAAANAGRLPELPPYNFDTLETLRDQLYTLEAFLARSQADANRARTDLAREQRRLREQTAERRAINALTPDADDRADRTRLARRQELAVVRERVAEATVELRSAQLDQSQQSIELIEIRLEVIRESINQIQPRVRFTQDDLDQRLARIADLQDRLTESFDSIRSQSADLRGRLNQWTNGRGADTAATDPRVEIAREILIVLGSRSEVIGERRRRTGVRRDGWTDRFAIQRGEYSGREISALEDDVEAIRRGLDADESALTDRARQVRSRLITLEGELATIAPGTSDLAVERIDAYRALAADIDGALEGVEVIRRNYAKLADLIAASAGISWWDRVVIAWSYITKIWSYEIIELDDNTALTVDKLVIGLFLLAVAFNLSRWLASLLSARVLPRFGLNTHAASAFKTILFYILLLTFALTALRIIEVPLTIFAVLGGAVAIGIGFGSQTIASNFMSGLILLAERPVRVGDFIDVNGVVGTVQQIGARSTRIKTPTNIEMILPNSTLLDNNLVNWTLTDQVVWLAVEVGIAYGSPTREASKLIMKAAEEHGRVLNTPPPRVLFDSFGDNSLNFRLFFAINMNQPSDRLSIPSDLRYRIDNLFRDADITIAFPQRDVHLDTLSPLQVELKRSRPASATAADDANEPTPSGP